MINSVSGIRIIGASFNDNAIDAGQRIRPSSCDEITTDDFAGRRYPIRFVTDTGRVYAFVWRSSPAPFENVTWNDGGKHGGGSSCLQKATTRNVSIHGISELCFLQDGFRLC